MDPVIRQHTVLENEPPPFPSSAVVYPFVEDSRDAVSRLWSIVAARERVSGEAVPEILGRIRVWDV